MRWVLRRVTERTRCERQPMMFRWVMFAVLAVLFLSWLFSMRLPWLEKLGLTKFNSSLDFKLFGRAFQLPVTIAIALCVTMVWLAKTVYTAYFQL